MHHFLSCSREVIYGWDNCQEFVFRSIISRYDILEKHNKKAAAQYHSHAFGSDARIENKLRAQEPAA